MEMHLRAYSFKSDKVTTEEISRIGDRYEMDAYMPRDFYSEDDQLKWGEYNSFWKRWGGESLNRKTLELKLIGSHDSAQPHFYICTLYRTHWTYRMALRKILKKLQAELDETQAQNKI